MKTEKKGGERFVAMLSDDAVRETPHLSGSKVFSFCCWEMFNLSRDVTLLAGKKKTKTTNAFRLCSTSQWCNAWYGFIIARRGDGSCATVGTYHWVRVNVIPL